MSTQSKVDPSTLGWVKHEIDETLKQARLALESFSENTGDKTRLRFCVTHLHQVVGTLLMVELDGAAMLAREVEQLAEAILNDQAEASSENLEVLTRGILLLPDHLARLQVGQRDAPLKHIELLNEMRAVRQAEPISALDLFAPDMSVRPPSTGAERASDVDYQALARPLRGLFQGALLEWLRDPTNTSPLARIAEFFDELRSQAPVGALEQLFWIAGGMVEGLLDGGLEPTPERKKYFARLDQQIKKIIDGGDKTALRKSSEEIARGLLYEVAQASSGGERVTQLKQAFELDALLAPSSIQGTSLPTPEVLASVASALGKEIETAQDLLSSYFDPQQPDESALEQLLDLLSKMTGTLDMLGVPPLKELVDALLETCRAIMEQRLEEPADASMPMAQALVLVENSAREMQYSPAEWRGQIDQAIARLRAFYAPEGGGLAPSGIEVSDADLTEHEFRQLVGVVGGEVGVNLTRIEELLEAFATDTTRLSQLDEVPGLLAQIQGAMQILNQEQAAQLADVARTHVEEIRAQALVPTGAVLDALAVCIGTIGAYLDGLKAGRQNLEGLIEGAIEDMEASLNAAEAQSPADAPALVTRVRHGLESWLQDPSNDSARGRTQQALVELAQIARRQGEDKIAKIGDETANLIRLVSDGAAELSDEIDQMLRQSLQTLIDLVGRQLAPAAAPAPTPVRATPTPSAAKTPPPEAADEEIMQIFIEDARDVFNNISKEFEVWRNNHENAASLTELRRGYHTIKGSGRMVGASTIAEFAWAIENLLNKVRDGKIAFDPRIIDLVGRAQDAIPQLVDELESGTPPTADVEGMREEAWAFAGGEPPTAPSASPVSVAAPARVAASPSRSAGLPQLDGTLLEIFTNEARGHLETLRNEIAACRAAGSACLVTQALFRATHTLAGNARSLDIQMMVGACAEAERLFHSLQTQQVPLDSHQIELVAQLEATVSELVAALNGAPGDAGALRSRFDEIAHAFHDESVAANAHAEPARAPSAAPMRPPAGPAPVPEPKSAEFIAERPEVEPDNEPSAPPVASFRETVARSEPPVARVPEPVPRAQVAVSEDTEIAEQLDPELLEIFQEEAVDILSVVDESLTHWRARPDERSNVLELKRALHTLKGGARMAGAMIMGELAHNTESALKLVEDGKISVSADLFDTLDEAHDLLVTMLDRIQAGRPVPSGQNLNSRLQAWIAGEPVPPPARAVTPAPATEVRAAPAPATAPRAVEPTVPAARSPEPAAAEMVSRERRREEVPEAAVASTAASNVTLAEPPDERRDETGEEGAAWPSTMERRGQIRVNTNLLNELVNYAGEVSIARARMEQQIYGFRDNLGELSRNVSRFRDQLRELEIQSESQILYRAESQMAGGRTDFDPLEFDRFSRLQQLSRSLTESLHDLSTIQINLGNFIGVAETTLAQQARINTDLQEGLMRTRMVAFSTQAGRLRHIVRQTARELGKRVELDLTGADVEVDRNVLERIVGPFEHMIRNSIDHGIEPESERRKRGKPVTGKITVATAQEGSEIVLRFSDDGGGLNTDAIRKKAIERELITADANLAEDELVQFILMPGFSTAEKITHLSGRGVGMDVVHTEVKQLGGTMTVDTQHGVGTTFTIRLPLTLSIAQALMVYVGDQQFAVPLASVANIIEYPVEQLHAISVGKNPLLNWNDQVYPYMSLATRLGVASPAPVNGKKVPVLLARTGTREVAMQVDGLGGTREVVIKPLGPQLAEIKGLGGATILGDGRVILILDVPGLWFREDTLRVGHQIQQPVAAAPAEKEHPTVMVVDDSLTVRKVTSKHLQKRGYEVMVAKDGIDAVEQLRERVPDLMLVDIEMPRMDGYELTSRVRSESGLKHVPIIMITSRAGAKHRQKAFDLGVDVYMSKPYQEEDLVKNIETLLARGHLQ
jgi:chemosensory pili system protein ChpA (sensor histidine kinase/response regulator)